MVGVITHLKLHMNVKHTHYIFKAKVTIHFGLRRRKQNFKTGARLFIINYA